MKIIDPHIHLFDLSQGNYQWLKPEQAPFWSDKHLINHSFTEQQFISTFSANEMAGFVHIEAGYNNDEPWREIAWLEQHCQLNFNSIAFIDVTLPELAFKQQLEKLLAFKSVVGCRHILDEDASKILSHPHAMQNLATLAKHQLSFDVQCSIAEQSTLLAVENMLSQHPNLNVIINHAGWPPIKANNALAYQHWRQALSRLSQYKQCAIKCSGWEMADRTYNIEWVEDVISHCIHYFGVDRVMCGSNFPLNKLSQFHEDIWQAYQKMLEKYDKSILMALCYNNARSWYKF